MNSMGRQDRIRLLDAANVLVEQAGGENRCIRCDFFDDAKDHCMHYQQDVPAEVQKEGCGEFVNWLPF